MKKLLNFILDKLTFFLLFSYNFSIILINIKKIRNANIIINQNLRLGFGNIFSSIDLSSRMFKKDILFIQFFDESRFHNKKIFDFLNLEKIIFHTSIYFKSIDKKFGEYDRYDRFSPLKKNIYQNILISLVTLIKKEKCKIINIPELYEIANKKIKKKHMKKYNINFSRMRYLNYWYYLIDKKPFLNLNFSDPIIQKLLKKKGETKSVCIYIREKKYISNETKNYSLYKDAIKYFKKKKFTIFLTGEIENFLKKNKKLINDVNIPIKKSKFDHELNLGMQFISDYFLGDSGGGSWFSMYKKASILVGDPEMFIRPNTKAFNYRLFFKNKEIKKKSVFYNKIKKEIIASDDVGHPWFLNKLGIQIKQENKNKILRSIKKNFI